MEPPLKLWGIGLRALKVEIVATFADVSIVKPPFTSDITNKTAWFLALNPLGKVCLLFAVRLLKAGSKSQLQEAAVL